MQSQSLYDSTQERANDLSLQRTRPYSAMTVFTVPMSDQFIPSTPTLDQTVTSPKSTKKPLFTRFLAGVMIAVLVFILYLTWHTSPPQIASVGITQQNFSSIPSGTTSHPTTISSNSTNGTIQVYAVGAIKHPGVYTLEVGARVYQLLSVAGGTLSNANLVAINLAAKLSDGQEVYVTMIGEIPPTYSGGIPGPGTGSNTSSQLVNLNTASSDELRQSLNISSTTAQSIITYRTQHGDFTSIDQLQSIISKSIYDKIKGLVTV